MRRLWVALAATTLLSACALTIGQPHRMKTYLVVLTASDGKTVQREVQADSIAQSDGCITFWRGKTLDTVLCGNMERVLVTEKN